MIPILMTRAAGSCKGVVTLEFQISDFRFEILDSLLRLDLPPDRRLYRAGLSQMLHELAALEHGIRGIDGGVVQDFWLDFLAGGIVVAGVSRRVFDSRSDLRFQ